MKKFLSILLAVMMVLSTVSFAAPIAVGTTDTASNVEAPVADTAPEAELAEVQTFSNTYGTLLYKLHMDEVTNGTAVGSGWQTDAVIGAWGKYQTTAITGSPALWLYAPTTLVKEGDNGFVRFSLPFSGAEIINFGNSGRFQMEAGKVYTITFDMRANAASDPTVSGRNDIKNNNNGNKVDVNVPNDGEWHTYALEYTAASAEEFDDRIDFYQESFKSSGAGSFDLDNISIYEKAATATITVVDENEAPLGTKTDVSTKGVLVSTLVDGLYTDSAKVVFDGKEYATTDTIVFGGDSTIMLVVEAAPEEPVSPYYNANYGEPLYILNMDEVTNGTSVGSSWQTDAVIGAWGKYQTTAITGSPALWLYAPTTLTKEGDNGFVRFSLPFSGAEIINFGNSGRFDMEAGKVYTITFDMRANAASAPTVSGRNDIKNNNNGNKVDVNVPNDGQWHTYALPYTATAAETFDDRIDFYQESFKSSGAGSFDLDNISIYEKAATATITVVDADDKVLATKTNISTTGVVVSTLVSDLYNATQTAKVVFDGKEYATDDTIVFGGNSKIELVVEEAPEVPADPYFHAQYGQTMYKLHFDNAAAGTAVASGWNLEANTSAFGHYRDEANTSTDTRFWGFVGTSIAKDGDNGYVHFDLSKTGEMAELRENGSFTMTAGKVYTFAFDIRTDVAGTGKIHNYRNGSTDVNVTFPADYQWHTYTLTYIPTADGEKPDFSIYQDTNTAGSFDVDNVAIYVKDATANVNVVDADGKVLKAHTGISTTGVAVSTLIEGLYDAADVTKIVYVKIGDEKVSVDDTVAFGGDCNIELVIETSPYFSEKNGTMLYQLHFDNVTDGASVGSGWQQASTWGTYKDSAIDFDGRMWLVNAGNTMTKEEDNGFLRLNVPFGGDEIFDFHPTTSNVSMKAGYTYTFTFDVRANAASFTPSTDDAHNYMYFAKAYASTETTIIHAPNDNTWHTYSLSYTPEADEEWGTAGGDYVYFYQKDWLSSGNGTFDIDNFTIYEKPNAATVTFKVDDKTVATAEVTTKGITPADLLAAAGKIKGYEAPTALTFEGTEYDVADTTSKIYFGKENVVVYLTAVEKEVSDFAPVTNQEADVRVGYGEELNTEDKRGMRFSATMKTADSTVIEAGWVVSTETKLGSDELTRELVAENKAVEGLNIDTNGTNKIFASENNVDTFAAVLTGIPAANYDDTIIARPFVVDADGIWYGDTFSGTYRDACTYVLESSSSSLTPEQIAALDEVING